MKKRTHKHLLQYQKLILLFIVLITTLSTQAQSFIGGRTDFRDESIYFVMTTRFYDGDSGNNVQCWDGQQYNQGDPAWRGDFKGLIEKLDYIKALGFTAIWITPIVENASGYDYHGYHAMDFKKVDPRYESEDVKFQDLIDAVHAKGMKIVLDVVFNHTGNFGEETLCPMFQKDYSMDLSDIASMKKHPNTKLPANYDNMLPGDQYQARLALMKNTDGQNHDTNNYWHHFGHGNWDNLTCQWMQIAGDCVDLNTENPAVYNYIVESYSKFIKMGVDGFRIDTGRHISRLVFNKVFNEAFKKAGQQMGKDFFMFNEICTRYSTIWYREIPAISTPFYTWKDSKDYAWSDDPSPYSNVAIYESNFDQHSQTLINQKSCIDNYNDNISISSQPKSKNAKLNGNDYHTPDYSMRSGMDVIDFPMHWNFKSAEGAFRTALDGDEAYNDATFNVVYVDSHDYAPDHAPENQRFAQPQDVWAENLSLMYTFRGIPCLYYGSEIEFKKGKEIDKGPNIALRESGRAYFGGYIKGDIQVNDFADYSNATGNMAVTLKHPLSQHIQRLSKIRMAIPALRKGQYSTENISGNLAFKRRYVDSNTDSYVCVAISNGATFNNVLNGTYVDAVTGDTKTVTNNTLSVSLSGKGNMRIYVLNTAKTPAPGKIGTDGKYIYTSSSTTIEQGTYPEDPEALEDVKPIDPIDPVDPVLYEGEQAIFFEKPSGWGSNINAYIYYDTPSGAVTVTKGWPGNSTTSLGNNIYKFAFEGTISNWYVLFNDGSVNQAPSSVGWDVVNGGYYNVSGLDHIIPPSVATIIDSNKSEDLKIYGYDGNIYIESNENKVVSIYSIDGRSIRKVVLNIGTNVVSGMQKGVYIINGKKVIL